MELYIGGMAQGKLSYVRQQTGLGEEAVVVRPEELDGYAGSERVIFYQFQEWFRQEIEQEKDPEEAMDHLLERHPQLIIICNEVGNGIVPLASKEREYRERLGRYLCRLAERAVRAERIVCGIGQRLK